MTLIALLLKRHKENHELVSTGYLSTVLHDKSKYVFGYVMQMSYILSEKARSQPKTMDCFSANNGADSVNDPFYGPKKVDQVAKFFVDLSSNSASKSGPISKRKPNLTISPPFDVRKMDPLAGFLPDSAINYTRIPSPVSSNSEQPNSAGMTSGAAGVSVGNTKTNGEKTTSFSANYGQGSGYSSRSNSLENASPPIRPHTGGDVRWDSVNMISKGSPLNLSHFRLLKRIGYGDIGSVYLVELRGTKAYFAMKVMDKASLESRNKLLRAQTEREILGLLDHPFLPTLYSHFETDKFYCLVMEFCSGGNLHSLRQKQPNKFFTEEAAR